MLMPKIIKKREILCFEGISISDFLDKKFLDKLKKEGLDMDPINLVFMVRNGGEGDEQNVHPIILTHEGTKELKSKLINISAPSTKATEKFFKLLGEME